MGLAPSISTLSAIITPALLILACASLIGATAQRLTRVIERTYRTSEEFQKWSESDKKEPFLEERRRMLLTQLQRATRRTLILQHAMTTLYLALSAMVGTSVAAGFTAMTGRATKLPLLVGMLAVALFFYATLVLIWESRLALASVHDEMDLVLQLSRRIG